MEAEPSGVADALLDASPDAIVVVDADGVIEAASPAVTDLFGFAPDELLGHPVELLLPEELRNVHTLHRQRYSRRPAARAMGANLDLKGRRKDGTVLDVDVSLAPTTVHGKLRIGAFVRDASMRKRNQTIVRHVNEISRAALACGDPAELFSLTAVGARDLLGAATAWVAVIPPSDPAGLIVAAASGAAAEKLVGSIFPASSSIAARVMTGSESFTVADMSGHPDVIRPARDAGLGPGLYVPMVTERGPVGALVAARERGGRPFDQAEVAALEGFASATAVVLALDRARQSVEELRILAGYERIGRDLHDTVIQKLFALGMGLQAAERMAVDPVRERINAAVEGIDEVIREIRETIFDLGHPSAAASPVRHELRQVIAEVTPLLGFAPRLALRGPVESEVTATILPHLVAVARESLSNAARHAHASAIDIVIQAANGTVTLTVSDNGIGLPKGTSAGNGLENMKTRAEQLGGTFSVTNRMPAGTLLMWAVGSGLSPLPPTGVAGP